MPEPSQWQRIVEANPEHSHWYIQRFRDMEAAGRDLYGEARLIDAMVQRNARILDAGCGPGRLGGYLHDRGHLVIGVDVDPTLIAAAEQDHPGPTWLVGDLAEIDVPLTGQEQTFDAILCAGNVMTFLAPSTRRDVLSGFARHLADDGRAIVGFGAERGYAFEDFRADVAASGLRVDLELGTWDLRPWTPVSDFLVSVLAKA